MPMKVYSINNVIYNTNRLLGVPINHTVPDSQYTTNMPTHCQSGCLTLVLSLFTELPVSLRYITERIACGCVWGRAWGHVCCLTKSTTREKS